MAKPRPLPKVTSTGAWIAGDGRPKAPVKPSVHAVPVAANPTTLADWTPGTCRWVLDDPGEGQMHLALWCGAAREGERQYCTQHAKLAFAPTTSEKELRRSLRRYAA